MNALEQAFQQFQQLFQPTKIISPVPENNTLDEPGKLNYVAQNQAHEAAARLNPNPVNINKTVQYPDWLANAPQPTTSVPPLGPNTPMILPRAVDPAVTKAYITNVLQNYHPQTPDVPQGWQSPLNNPAVIQRMVDLATQYRLHPALQPLLAIAETQLMRPAASGTPNLNPYNVRLDDQEFNYNQPGMGLNYALEKLPYNITQGWTGQGWQNFRQNPTLQNFIHAHNPVDNPQQEINLLLSVANQIGVNQNGY